MVNVIIPTFSDTYLKKPINLDITNKCPLQCPSCLRQSPAYITARRNYNEMSIDEFKKDILESKEWVEFYLMLQQAPNRAPEVCFKMCGEENTEDKYGEK